MADALAQREHASRINPIISPVGKTDTISQCAHLVESLGHFISSTEGNRGHVHLLTGTIAAALHYELEVAHV